MDEGNAIFLGRGERPQNLSLGFANRHGLMAGAPNPKIEERVRTISLDPYQQRGFPVVFWDLFGEEGHPVRTTVSEMGPLLLARLMDLNPTQEGVLNIAFKLADEEGLLL